MAEILLRYFRWVFSIITRTQHMFQINNIWYAVIVAAFCSFDFTVWHLLFYRCISPLHIPVYVAASTVSATAKKAWKATPCENQTRKVLFTSVTHQLCHLGRVVSDFRFKLNYYDMMGRHVDTPFFFSSLVSQTTPSRPRSVFKEKNIWCQSYQNRSEFFSSSPL